MIKPASPLVCRILVTCIEESAEAITMGRVHVYWKLVQPRITRIDYGLFSVSSLPQKSNSIMRSAKGREI